MDFFRYQKKKSRFVSLFLQRCEAVKPEDRFFVERPGLREAAVMIGTLERFENGSIPYHPWDGYIYLHEWLIFMVFMYR